MDRKMVLRENFIGFGHFFVLCMIWVERQNLQTEIVQIIKTF